MARARTKNSSDLVRPAFSSFGVEKEFRQRFKARLNWSYEDQDIAGFRIYRAEYPRTLLEKSYTIGQRALEVLTTPPSNRWKNNLLYDKSCFAINSRVRFEVQEETRHKVSETQNFDRLNYRYWGFVRAGKKEYSYVDTSIKFGGTYAYVITAVTKTMSETSFGLPTIVKVEDLTPPVEVANFELQTLFDSVLVNAKFSNILELKDWEIYRRRVGDLNFELVGKQKVEAKKAHFIDRTVTPGNEYEYRVYALDLFDNRSWASPVRKIEFLSTYLKKGAVIDPVCDFTYEEPAILFRGKKNNDRIIGYRLEKLNSSRNEIEFKVGSDARGVSWPNVLLFDENDEVSLLDEKVEPDNIYRYRVSSIALNGKVESYFFTPPITVAELPVSNGFTEKKLTPPRLLDFDVRVLDSRQNPVYVKLSWKIDGDWDYAILSVGNFNIKIDSVHDHIYFDRLSRGKSYDISLKLYSLDGSETSLGRVSKIRI